MRDDLWYEVVASRDDLLGRWEQGLQDGVEVLGAHTPAGERLEETRLLFVLRAEFPRLLEKWRELRGAAPTPPAQ